MNEIEHVDQYLATTLEHRADRSQNMQVAQLCSRATCTDVSPFTSTHYSTRELFPCGDTKANNLSHNVIKYRATCSSTPKDDHRSHHPADRTDGEINCSTRVRFHAAPNPQAPVESPTPKGQRSTVGFPSVHSRTPVDHRPSNVGTSGQALSRRRWSQHRPLSTEQPTRSSARGNHVRGPTVAVSTTRLLIISGRPFYPLRGNQLNSAPSLPFKPTER